MSLNLGEMRCFTQEKYTLITIWAFPNLSRLDTLFANPNFGAIRSSNLAKHIQAVLKHIFSIFRCKECKSFDYKLKMEFSVVMKPSAKTNQFQWIKLPWWVPKPHLPFELHKAYIRKNPCKVFITNGDTQCIPN